MSTRGLIPGEPIAPQLRRVLQAADRPLSTHEVALAMLDVRGLRYRGRELSGIVNRISSMLCQDATAGHVARVRTGDPRRPLWVWATRPAEAPEGADPQPGGTSAQPSGSMG